MARPCSVCTHDDRPAIDMALVNHKPFRTITAQFKLSTGALVRHHDDHLSADLVRVVAAEVVSPGDDLSAELVALKDQLRAVLDRAERGNNWRGIAALHREVRGYIELLLEVERRIDRRPTVNLLVLPEWVAMRSALLDALRPHPSARTAVAARLVALGAP